MTETTSRAIAETIVGDAKGLPTAPPIVFKLMSLLKKPTIHNHEIIEIIRYDEHLTAKLLKLCNTAFYKSSSPTNSLDEVVIRLGYANITSIAVSLRVNDVVSKAKETPYMNPYDLWRRSVTASIAAKDLASKCQKFILNGDTAFTCGLLHNIGMVVLNVCELPDISKIYPLAMEEGISLIEAEEHVLGTNHTEIGALLLEKWNIPEEISVAVRHYAMPELSESSYAKVCHLASICSLINAGMCTVENLPDLVDPAILETLGLTELDILGTLQTIDNESVRIETMMMMA